MLVISNRRLLSPMNYSDEDNDVHLQNTMENLYSPLKSLQEGEENHTKFQAHNNGNVRGIQWWEQMY